MGFNFMVNMMSTYKKSKKIFGVGVNDADYNIEKCKFYKRWVAMLARCYARIKPNTQYRFYLETTVCDEWLTFSNFKNWMQKQDWEGKCLDKDLIGDGSIYSPETCCFISTLTNNFINRNLSIRGDLPIGCSFHKKTQKYAAACRNPYKGGNVHLGLFDDPKDAHLAWAKYKKYLATIAAENESDERAKIALLKMNWSDD